MKKVLLTITSLRGGGAERVVSVWSKQLKEKGYDVSILVCERFDGEYKIAEGIEVFSIAKPGEKFGDISLFKRLKLFRKIIKEHKPDAVINFLPKMQMWMMLATMGKKVRKIETIRISPWHANSSKLNKFLWHRCFRKSNAVILQTAEQGEYFSKKIQKKCHVVYNPISKQCIDNPKTEYKQPINFVGVGRITEQKNFPLMINSFKIALDKFPQIKLFIYGEGSDEYNSKLISLINENNLSENVFLMGRTNDVTNVLKNADAFLMSSDFEGLPNSLIEAMCVGLPCVSTDCRTGPKDLIDDGINGYLAKVGDENDFASKIINILEKDVASLSDMGRKAREKVLDLCGEERSLNQLIKVIEGNNNA